MIDITDMTDAMNAEEAAKKLNVHVETVRRAARRGEIEAVKIGRGYRISQAALTQYVKRQTVGAK